MANTWIRRVVATVATCAVATFGSVVMAAPASAGTTICPASVDTDVEGWVCMLYNIELFRSPSDDEVAFWTSVHDSQGALAVTEGIMFSGESVRGYVEFVYSTQLARAADPAGLAFWSSSIQQHLSELPFELGVFSSGEFLATFASSEEFVGFLYDYYFGRAADPAGLEFWSGQLDTEAMTPAEVILFFQHHIEAGRLVVEIAYLDILGRSADPAGMDFWDDRGAEVGLLRLIAEIGASAEAIATLGAEGQAGAASAGAVAAGGRKG